MTATGSTSATVAAATREPTGSGAVWGVTEAVRGALDAAVPPAQPRSDGVQARARTSPTAAALDRMPTSDADFCAPAAGSIYAGDNRADERLVANEPPRALCSCAVASVDVFRLSDELLESLCALRPVAATFYGIAGHDHAWDDLSPAGTARLAETLRAVQRRVPAVAPGTTYDERLATLVLDDFVRMELARIEHDDHLADLNSIASPLQYLRLVFDAMPRSGRRGWSDVVERLSTLDTAFTGYRDALDEGRRRGNMVARRQVLAAIREARVHAGSESYFLSLPATFAATELDDANLAARLARGVEHARGAFAAFGDYLEERYLPVAREVDPVGRERYLRDARRFLGIEIDPLETFHWGLEEVRSIAERMEDVAQEIAPGAGPRGALALLESDPARAAATPEDFVRLMAERQACALAELAGRHFDVPPPVRRLEVKLAPKGGALGAYYMPPAADFERPGTVWYAPGDRQHIPLYDQVSTAYHEGFPGHHLQIGIQIGMRDRLSSLHRVAVDNHHGYAEGWALYAERLMEELGYYEKPDYVFGLLSNQMMRACRVVLDIGAHLELTLPASSPFRPGARIDWDLGVAMLTELTGLPRDHAESEMTRYLGWPGQAIAYKVGERVLCELRAEAKRRARAAFDLRAFHAKVLGTGAVGLALLQELVLAEYPGGA